MDLKKAVDDDVREPLRLTFRFCDGLFGKQFDVLEYIQQDCFEKFVF